MAALVIGLVLPAPVEATIGVDDYPNYLKNAAQDSLVDPWNFYNRECTSFVAWRLNHDAGIAFHNWFKGHHWGDAAIWKRQPRLRRARGRNTESRRDRLVGQGLPRLLAATSRG